MARKSAEPVHASGQKSNGRRHASRTDGATIHMDMVDIY